MNNGIRSLIEVSINIELSVSDIYFLFYNLFPEDEQFWWKLVLEEKNHASLIRSGKEYILSGIEFPDKLVHHNLQNLRDMNRGLRSLIEKIKNNPPSREEAFNMALKIENSACEMHFQEFMDKQPITKIEKIFMELNKEDKDHAKRIHSYMVENGIKVLA